LIIGLSGYAQSGKDTVAELLCLNYGFKRIAFADAIREGVVRLNPMLVQKLGARYWAVMYGQMLRLNR
jgi:dephospho-CoA kinase